jgi:methylase of polypeptide subunit release factors
MRRFAPEDARRLREFFAAAGYTATTLRTELALNKLPSRRLRTIPPMLDRTREATAGNTLARWFFIGVTVTRRQAAPAIPDWVVGLLLESEMLRAESDLLIPEVRVTPIDSLLIASDCALNLELPGQSGLVLWPNPTTRLLSLFTIRTHSGRTLDLGTGCGLLALEAATHSDTVIATDLNPRAIEFAVFNASLKGVENVEFRTGDCFEPVAGETFDRIVANPPFFVTPSTNHLFSDSGMELDGFCRKMIREGPAHLNEGGFLQMIFEWAQVEGERWQDRLAGWLEGSGCDAWIIKGPSHDPSAYAQTRFQEAAPYTPDSDETMFGEWMDYYRRCKVEAIHGGMIAMRRRPGRNWVRFDETQYNPQRPFGDSVARMFSTQDFFEANAAAGRMLAAKFKLSPDVELEQRLRRVEDKWQIASLNLKLNGGLAFSQPLDPLVAEFVTACDGSRSSDELIDELAAKVDASREVVERECLALIRRLVEREFLTQV